MRSKSVLALPAALALSMSALVHAPAQAAGPASDDNAATQWGVGVGLMTKLRPWRGTGSETDALPIVSFENRWVRIFGPGVDVKLGSSGPLAFEVGVRYVQAGYKPSDSSFLEGMQRRKDGFWAGGRVVLSTDLAQFNADWWGDASGHSKGQVVRLGVERRYAFGDLGVIPRITATWQDASYVDYYYGVRAAEARSGRAAYSAGSAVNTEVGVRLAYRLGGPHLALADAGVTALGASIKKSPLVERKTVPELRLAYLYQF